MSSSFGAARVALAAGASILVLLAMPATSSASYDPIGSGATRLTLDGGFVRVMKEGGVRLLGRGPAKVHGGAATLPSAGGKADPTIAKAEIELGGELIFATARHRVPLTKITLKTKPTPLFARLGGGQLKIAKAASVSLRRDGFGNELRATKLRLTEKTATRLNKRLDLDVFSAGQVLGSLRATALPSTVAVLPTGSATLAIDPAMAAKLKALSTSVNPIAPVELFPGPALSLPIAAEGAIAPDATGGTLRTGGSIELLRLGAGQLFVKELWLDLATRTLSAEVDLEPAPAYAGKLGRVAVFDLAAGGGTIASEPTARTIGLSAAPVTLDPSTADLFDRAFAEGADQFHAGEVLGLLSFVAQAQ